MDEQKHVYIQGDMVAVTKEQADSKVLAGEWYVCDAEHTSVEANTTVYHRECLAKGKR